MTKNPDLEFAVRFGSIEGLSLTVHNNKWGFVDKKDVVIIPFIYEHASHFSEGLAGVKLDGKYGFIDKQGNLVIPHKYDEVRRFDKHQIASVKIGDKEGFIDKNGNEVIPIIFERVDYPTSKTLKFIRVWVGDRHLWMDLELNYYQFFKDYRKEKLDCPSCIRHNDKLMTGLCCKFKKKHR